MSDRYALDPLREDQAALAAAHISLVRQVAACLARRLPLPLEELVSLGWLGLLTAAAAWDSSTGVPFPAYARSRVRGAILDALRAGEGVMGFRRRLRAEVLTGHDGRDLVAATPGPAAALALADDAALVRAAVACLPPQQRGAVVLVYFRGLPLAEVAAALGVSVRRVHQLKKVALRRLRGMLGSANPGDPG